MPVSPEPLTVPTGTFATLPDPAAAGSLDELVERLRLLKVWAGDPSYETIKERVNAAWTAAGRPASELARRSTVANCFQPGRRRFNTELVTAVVEALHPDVGYVTQWRQALRVIGGETEAVAQVRVLDRLPEDLAGFTGRAGELDRLRHSMRRGDAVVISAIEGMAGVGKTRLAVHAGHLLHRQEPFEQVLFVNLRGFHPDRAQPPADPAAVLEGFLRLLGVPGHQIPHDLPARAAAYRARMAGTRALVVLDNAASAEQVRSLLPATPGCLTLITSRRSLTGLRPATRLAVDVFTADEALTFLAGALPGVPVGSDPAAAERIAHRCGYLPLALSLIAGHVLSTPGWTLTDHADRLDERHRERRLDSGVELALDISYQNLGPDQQRLLRLAALHPGQDFDAYAAAALAGTDPDTARTWLAQLRADHLLQQVDADRYTFHDLVRAYATGRAHDQDPPSVRRAALTRLFDHYLAATAAAMAVLYPAEAHARPAVAPAVTPAPGPVDPQTAVAWLDTERSALVSVVAYTAANGWSGHTTRLARVLYRYLNGSGHEALTVHGDAVRAARDSGDLAEQAHALTNLGGAHLEVGRTSAGAEHSRQALELFRRIGDPAGQARALHFLGIADQRSGRYEAALDSKRQALALFRQAGDRSGEANALNGLGIALRRAGHLLEAIDHHQQALVLTRAVGNRYGEANALNSLGYAEMLSGRLEPAGEHLRQALVLHRRLSNRVSEANVLDSLGLLHASLGEFERALEHHGEALVVFREAGDQDNQAWALNGLGEAARGAGRPAEARAHHTAACTIATDAGVRMQEARAHTGLGHVHRDLGEPGPAREHYERALALYTDLGVPEADQIRAHLAHLHDGRSGSPDS